MRAILSVSDKTGLVDFARALANKNIELFSTGGTKKALAEGGVQVRGISELTGFPEILEGRVKTLHPAVHGGILCRRDLPADMEEMSRHGLDTIDMVVVNLYPFVRTVSTPDVSLRDALENIDIGGPTLIRAAAKNFPHVIVVVAPGDYPRVLEMIEAGDIGIDERKRLAQKAFQHVALYDTAISQYLLETENGFALPENMTIALNRKSDLRYGENPHQSAAFYREERIGDVLTKNSIAEAKQLWGKELSFNNILDADAAWNAVTEFIEPTVAIIKHTNPCGLASHDDLAEAYRRALSGDPVSAFGGIVATNRPVNAAMANEVLKTFYEIITAPGYEPEALPLLQSKKDLRILDMGPLKGEASTTQYDYRHVGGGFLIQMSDTIEEDPRTWRLVSKRPPSAEEMESLIFAWKGARNVKSNAIVITKGTTLLGMGAGQPSRVDSVEIALKKAGSEAKGAVLASDAMFPFPDGIEIAAKGGVTAIVHPGGSVRDEMVIEAADKYDLAMLFTGIRHFKH
ncbi:MAG: bifunctional phosphoribosylaminoimidazolecarboxamide formyltransferase/IMP cyclohydrolase [Dehalococcoidia bacterium]